MCGRYVLALRYGQVQQVLDDNGLATRDHQPAQRGRGRAYWGDGAEEADEAGEGQGDSKAESATDANSNTQATADVDTEADADADTQPDADPDAAIDNDSIFQPSYNFAPGFHGIVVRAVLEDKDDSETKEKYQMQVMKWGLVPSWTQTRPDYASTLKTINCRADSLSTGVGLWAGLRSRKRCIVVASGFYEWLAKDRERVPHYIQRQDGLPLLFAGLWDCAVLDGVKTYTYTIITTDSNQKLKFLHDRMPVVFDYGSEELALWLGDSQWSPKLAALLKPWSGELLVDVVSQEVNKTGRSSARFIVPVASADNRANIANFFKDSPKKEAPKRKAEEASPPAKKAKISPKPTPSKLISPKKKTPVKEAAGSQKITSFFGKG